MGRAITATIKFALQTSGRTYGTRPLCLGGTKLSTAMDAFESSTGCRPVIGDSHKHLGTKNALATLLAPEQCYIEIIGPDPDNPTQSTIRSDLEQVRHDIQLHHYAIRSSNLPFIAAKAERLGLGPSPITDLSRTTPDGELLAWKMLFLRNHSLGGAVPFFIDWLDCRHPTLPCSASVCRLVSFTVHAPPVIGELLEGIEDLTVVESVKPSLELVFETPIGLARYQTDDPIVFQ